MTQIDYFCRWNTETEARQDAVRLRNYFGVGSSAIIQDWYLNQFLPNVKAWRPSQDTVVPSTIGSSLPGTVVHSYLTGWFGILSLDHVENVIMNDNSLAFALDRDGPPYILKNNIGAVIQDVGVSPTFLGSHYPLGRVQFVTQVALGPYNIRYGNSAFFTAEFFDASRNTTTPLSATLSITYTNINNISQNDLVTLLPAGDFLTGTWSSTNASPGLAPWTITAFGFSSAAQQGIIRVYDP